MIPLSTHIKATALLRAKCVREREKASKGNKRSAISVGSAIIILAEPCGSGRVLRLYHNHTKRSGAELMQHTHTGAAQTLEGEGVFHVRAGAFNDAR